MNYLYATLALLSLVGFALAFLASLLGLHPDATEASVITLASVVLFSFQIKQ